MPYTVDYIKEKLTKGLNASHVVECDLGAKTQERLRILVISLFALLLRWCIAYHSHSGDEKPPMYGDYEAQRHWQEITFNLPVRDWYINTTDNDLLYWGLDYPPITAYHSLALGYVANAIDPSYVELHKSRGLSHSEHKYFMRLSVLLIDIFLYIPAIVYFIRSALKHKDAKSKENIFGFSRQDVAIFIALIYPGIITIDHGHFQYNCASLGLFVAAVAAMFSDLYLFGSFLFVMALNYKQMELYHSLPFFFYILGICTFDSRKSWLSRLRLLASISLTVALSFVLIWLPFLVDTRTFVSAVLRLFPVSRGIFEDKVANIWCSVNIFVKLRNIFTNELLAKICLIVTGIAVLPAMIDLFLRPSKKRFVISLIVSALGFFLFSFQVHEKSILLAAIPVILHFYDDPLPCFWFLLTSHFSMLPLYMKDNLYAVYLVTFLFYFFTVLWSMPDIFNRKESANISEMRFEKMNGRNEWCTILFYASVLGMLILSIVSRLLRPPARYPDLFPLLVSVYSCGHFLIFYVYFNYKQFLLDEDTYKKLK